MLSQQQQQQFPQPPHILPRPPSFDRWSGGNAGPQQAEGEDNTHGLQHQQQPHQPMIQVFPQQPAMPMLPPMVGPMLKTNNNSRNTLSSRVENRMSTSRLTLPAMPLPARKLLERFMVESSAECCKTSLQPHPRIPEHATVGGF
uniref:Uncharacterized protein n=1 Tax=Ditylenchus dipsaci TaxID=166011 RepID=A0A915DHY4_9BILA